MIGGRTNVWGRQSYRLSDLDFKAKSHDGYDADWPISYADLAPYYDIVEEYVGISGQTEGVAELPDGHFQPAMPMTCAETRLRTRVKQKLGRTVTIGRTANLTKPINGRQACHYCGPCERGCVTHSYFNSAFTTVADALKTGKCTLIPNAMAWKVLTDPATNRATGILYIDRNTHEAKEVHARVVVLCAQALESVRILLNSANREYPNGLANSSGALGHYLMDHHSVSGAFGGFAGSWSPTSRARAARTGRTGSMSSASATRRMDRSRRTSFADTASRAAAAAGSTSTRQAMAPPTRRPCSRSHRAASILADSAKRWPKFDNFVEIDPSGAVDAFGIPIAEDPHEVRRQRADDDEGHGGDRGRDARGRRSGRRRFVRPAEPGAWLGHSRSRHRAHGRRSEDVRPDAVLPHPRRRESVCHGWVGLCLDRLPESRR